jgi:hypothetical protein
MPEKEDNAARKSTVAAIDRFFPTSHDILK